MRVLVTGVSGFVGGHLAEHLVAAGDLVVGLSASGRWPEGLAHLARPVRLERCDLAEVDEADLADLIGRKQPEVIYHLAAQANPQASLADPRGTWALNLGGTLNLLEAVKAAGLKPPGGPGRLGGLLRQPRPRAPAGPEDCPLRPNNPYSASKAAADLLGIQHSPGARHRRGDGPPVQPRRPAAVADATSWRPGAAGGRGRGRAASPASRSATSTSSATSPTSATSSAAIACWPSAGHAGEIYNLGSGRGTKLADALEHPRVAGPRADRGPRRSRPGPPGRSAAARRRPLQAPRRHRLGAAVLDRADAGRYARILARCRRPRSPGRLEPGDFSSLRGSWTERCR